MAGHIITVVGGKGGVGKSQVAANLAFAFAMENRQKVLLLDFDQKACGDQNIITGGAGLRYFNLRGRERFCCRLLGLPYGGKLI